MNTKKIINDALIALLDIDGYAAITENSDLQDLADKVRNILEKPIAPFVFTDWLLEMGWVAEKPQKYRKVCYGYNVVLNCSEYQISAIAPDGMIFKNAHIPQTAFEAQTIFKTFCIECKTNIY